jgi:hypothetical protein
MIQTEIGKLIEPGARRDAIHVAVYPAEAMEKLRPGQHVGAQDGKADSHYEHLGIVDPFLTSPVKKGEWFWVFLYPNTITSLKHSWTHPAFEDEVDLEELKQLQGEAAIRKIDSLRSVPWLESFANEVGVPYETLMESAKKWLEMGRYHALGYDTPNIVYEKKEEFWKHYENVTGQRVENKEETFFTCAC